MDNNKNFKKEVVSVNNFSKSGTREETVTEEVVVTPTEETRSEEPRVDEPRVDEPRVEQPVVEKDNSKRKQFLKSYLISKIVEFAFILSIVFIPCFVANLKIEGQYYDISYGFVDVIGLFVEQIKNGDYLSLLYDIVTVYTLIFVISGFLSSGIGILTSLSNYKKDKLPRLPSAKEKKKNGNIIVNIVIGLAIGYALNLIDVAILKYLASNLYHKVNMLVAIPAVILLVYIVVSIKLASLKKEVYGDEK